MIRLQKIMTSILRADSLVLALMKCVATVRRPRRQETGLQPTGSKEMRPSVQQPCQQQGERTWKQIRP